MNQFIDDMTLLIELRIYNIKKIHYLYTKFIDHNIIGFIDSASIFLLPFPVGAHWKLVITNSKDIVTDPIFGP